MDSESRAFEAFPFESSPAFSPLGNVPIRCRAAMIPQDVTPWTLARLAAALLRVVPRLPSSAPALVRARNSRD